MVKKALDYTFLWKIAFSGSGSPDVHLGIEAGYRYIVSPRSLGLPASFLLGGILASQHFKGTSSLRLWMMWMQIFGLLYLLKLWKPFLHICFSPFIHLASKCKNIWRFIIHSNPYAGNSRMYHKKEELAYVCIASVLLPWAINSQL